jgi:hypothetical protein
MSNRVVVQEGYEIPFAGFDAYRRKSKGKRKGAKRRSTRRQGKQQSVMRECAKRWSARMGRGSRSYRAFMKDCLSK